MGKHVCKSYVEMNELALRTVFLNRKYVNAVMLLSGTVFRRFRKIAVAQLVEALRYKPERRGFDSRWCHWNFSLT
jgi:hypothetical protein